MVDFRKLLDETPEQRAARMARLEEQEKQMSGNGGGNKPAIKVAIKPKTGDGGRISLCAAWRDEQSGKLRASLDKRVTRVVVVLDDGTKIDVQRGPDGKPTHFVDIFENDAPAPRQQSRSSGRRDMSMDDLLGGGGGGDTGPAGGSDYGADDIPFAPRKL